MTSTLSVLLVEDNQELAAQVVDFLSSKEMLVDYAHSGQSAIALIKQQSFDIVILDLMLPDADGYELCGQLKGLADSHLPVLMLTARDSLNDKLQGFQMGADDYLTKPFALEEVYMRCLALSRRVSLHQNKILTIGELSLDAGQRCVSRQGKLLSLSQTDFLILNALMMAYPSAVSKRELNNKIWGDDTPESDALRSHIYTLRNAVDKPFSRPMIKTVHGIGFRLEVTG